MLWILFVLMVKGNCLVYFGGILIKRRYPQPEIGKYMLTQLVQMVSKLDHHWIR